MYSAWSKVFVTSPFMSMRISENVKGVSALGFIFISLYICVLVSSNSSSPVSMMSSTWVTKRPLHPCACAVFDVRGISALWGSPITVLLPKLTFLVWRVVGAWARITVGGFGVDSWVAGRMYSAWYPVVTVIFISVRIAFLSLLCHASPDSLSPYRKRRMRRSTPGGKFTGRDAAPHKESFRHTE